MYEKSKAENDKEEAIDRLLLEVSQEVEKLLAKCEHKAPVAPTTKAGSSMKSSGENKCNSTRFSCAKSASEVAKICCTKEDSKEH